MAQKLTTPIGTGKSATQTEGAYEVASPLLFDAAGPLPPYTGPELTSWQYEALCRHALSRQYAIPIDNIKTGYVEGPAKTPGNIRHQIDLYWTSNDGVCDFLCFANAKFLKRNIELGDIMTLLGVQRDIHAHKAMIITNTGYSAAARLQAQEKGIALLIVRPSLTLDVASLPKRSAPTVAQAIEKISTRVPPVYDLNVIHRGLDLTRNTAPPSPCPRVGASASLPVPQSAFSNQHSAIPARLPNKMIPSAPRAPGSFGIRRK